MRRSTGYPGSSSTTTITTTATNGPTSLLMTLRVPQPAEIQSIRNEMQTYVESSEGSELGSLQLFSGNGETTTVRQLFGTITNDAQVQELTRAISTDPGVLRAVMNVPEVQELFRPGGAAAQAGSSTSSTSIWSRIRRFLVGSWQRIWGAIKGILDSLLEGISNLLKTKFLKAFGASILTLSAWLAMQLFV